MGSFIRSYWPALGCALLLIAWEWATRIGLFLVFILPVYLLWLIYAALASAIKRDRERIRRRLVNAGIWLVAISIMVASLTPLRWLARQDADAALAAVNGYAAKYGHYPKTLVDAQYLHKHTRIIYGVKAGEPPLLAYPDVFTFFDRYYYDFSSKRWSFHPD